MKYFLIILMLISIVPLSSAFAVDSIISEEIEYIVDGQSFKGLLTYDSSIQGKRPGILVVHEWQGINDYAKKRAMDLAKEGYVAFALDMYGDGKEVPRSDAASISRRVGSDFDLISKRFNAALDIIKGHKYTDDNNIAAIGYCFGGGIVLNMARMGTDINGVVGFHSSLNTGLTAKSGDINTKILAIQGDMDPVAPLEKQTAFENEMKASGADYTYIIYDNVKAHNFTNPAGSSYYEKEAEMAWDSMLGFFDSIFN
ncbi:MAG: dienelactone hydrolase family protein [Spirochaetales bacterium]|uniref:Dienelactone hydrolase family protein n=1 Tax=Candidatus Thalassospirochaeta sargassi TaxID=3119039 RepID=A0AAJ1MMV1_9SPIO|nr:dienelactone hydrolase family protein [Spirochaetales bacterium]